MPAVLANTLELALDSAPWLVLGLVAAGLIRAWLPLDTVARGLGGTGLRPVLRAAIIGIPLPLCSCGVLPAALALRRAGASRASTTAFLVATPETGVDSIALSWVLLGPVLAVVRPIAALGSALTAGLLVGLRERPAPRLGPLLQVSAAAGTCAPDCGCAAPAPRPGWAGRTKEGLHYAFVDLLQDIGRWLLLGILVAGVAVTLVPPDALARWGSGLPAMLLVLVAAVPLYVCATASTPLGLAMLWAGVSPGTVLVFLLAGPATNLGTMALIGRELGRPALAAYLLGVGGVSVLAGLLLDAAVTGIALPDGGAALAQGGPDTPLWVSVPSLTLLLAAGLIPLLRRPHKAEPPG